MNFAYWSVRRTYYTFSPLDGYTLPPPFADCGSHDEWSTGVSGERLSSLLGHVTHRGFDDLVDPKNQGIAYPMGNPDLLITGDPIFYTNLLATLDMFRLNSASLTFNTTDEG